MSVLKPSVKNKKGLPVLMYRRLLIGQEQKQQIVLVNDGNLKSTIFVDLVDESGVFDIQQVLFDIQRKKTALSRIKKSFAQQK